jgi:hypothetical protein
MNQFTHFLTGHLAARGCKQNHNQFLSFFTATAAVVPDFDYVVGRFVPNFPHGVFTHTILGGLLFALAFSGLSFFLMYQYCKETQLSFVILLKFAIIGMLAHLFLDSFTFYEGPHDAIHHMYFWPIWNFPVHINTLFPATTYTIRVWVEVVYTVIICCIILFYGGLFKKERPWEIFLPIRWLEAISNKKKRIRTEISIFYCLSVISMIVTFL